ncbi:MAG: IS1634 family transposase [Candidatus Brocadiia bacterium]
MASVTKKFKKGRPYYYISQCKRVDGKPRVVYQKYLGTVDRIIERMEATEPATPKETVLFEAGGVAALLGIARRLGLLELIDEIVPKRNQGPSVGHYMVLAALNRALAPCSKVEIGQWYESTILRRLWGFKKKAFSSQRFWDHMDRIDQEHIMQIQERLLEGIGEEFGVQTDVLLFDTTNFFTFIASTNARNHLAQRGRNKQKRSDLRQVGLSLMASRAFQVPLLHRVYAGNLNDLTVFPEAVRNLTRRYRALLGDQTPATLVCDRGCMAEDVMEQLAASQVQFVCSVPSNYFPEIFATPVEDLASLEGVPGTRAQSFPVQLWSKDCQVVLTYSESLYTQQLDSITRQMVKCQKDLAQLQRSLQNRAQGGGRGKRPTAESTKGKVRKILSGQYLSEVIQTDVKGKKGKIPTLHYQVNHQRLAKLGRRRLGRTVLVTDQLEWEPQEVVRTYRQLARIEETFKNMKGTDFLRWQPAWHWTDQKLRVHGLYCVLALTLVRLMRKVAHEAGEELSVPKLLEELSGIKEVALIYPEHYKKRGAGRLTNSRMSKRQLRLAKALEIGEVMAWG